jgi:hypothetical protein
VLSIKIYRLKYINEKPTRVKAHWQHAQRPHLQERALVLNAEGRVLASAMMPEQQQLAFGINEPMLDFVPAAAEHSVGLAAAAAAAVDVGSGNNSSSGSLSSSSFASLPAPPAMDTNVPGASGTVEAANGVPATNLSVPGFPPLPS